MDICVSICLAEARFHLIRLCIVAVQADFRVGRRFHNSYLSWLIKGSGLERRKNEIFKCALPFIRGQPSRATARRLTIIDLPLNDPR
jgi:hypothetical protein